MTRRPGFTTENVTRRETRSATRSMAGDVTSDAVTKATRDARGNRKGHAGEDVRPRRVGRRTVAIATLVLAASLVAAPGVTQATAEATPAAPSTAPSHPLPSPPPHPHGLAAQAGTHTQGVRVALPAPTGTHQVGTTRLHLVDRKRRDPWIAGQTHRELMVSIRYPARNAGRYPRAPQMLPSEAAAFDAESNFSEQVPKGKVNWGATLTHAHEGAPVARHRGQLPVVLYSPGAGDPRSLGTTLCDELASRGYVVVTVDHTYEAPAVQFPDGRVAHSVLRKEAAEAERTGRITELLKKLTAVRVADTRFVLDELEKQSGDSGPALPDDLRESLDLDAIGMFGQSAGGFTAAQTMHDDRRIKAAVNLDGVLGYTQRDDDPSHPSTVGIDGVDRPLLLMGKEGDTHHTVASWDAVWRHSSGWHRDLTLAGSQHASFTDAESLIPQIARQLDIPRATVTKMLGTIAPDRAIATQRAYVSAFFDRWLRGQDNGLLNRPSPRYPEMRFVP